MAFCNVKSLISSSRHKCSSNNTIRYLSTALGSTDDSSIEDCSSDEENDAAGRKDRAVRAWKNKIAPAILRIGNTIFEHSRDLITDLSGEGDSVPSDILDKLKAQKRHFSLISADPSCVVAPALEAHNIRLPPKEVSAMCANVKEVVDLVIKKFDKHFGVIMPMRI